MKYNFDEPVDRSQNRSAKYDECVKNFGTNDVIPLWIADMDFKTAQPIIDACKKKAEEGIWGYTSRPDSYFKAYADWQERRNGWKFDPSLCSWSLGVVPALAGIIKLFTQKGEKVLIQPPVYPEFFDITENTGRTLVQNNFLERDGVWEVDFEDFERQAKDPEVKLFILCNPHNPLGRVWTKEELERMLTICFENDVLVVSDEIHSDLIFHGKKHTPAVLAAPGADKKGILYNQLLMSEKLYPHLLEIDWTAQERVDTMLPHMMEAAGVTEELKACDPMRWVGLMNTLTAQIEEILIRELICS